METGEGVEMGVEEEERLLSVVIQWSLYEQTWTSQ